MGLTYNEDSAFSLFRRLKVEQVTAAEIDAGDIVYVADRVVVVDKIVRAPPPRVLEKSDYWRGVTESIAFADEDGETATIYPPHAKIMRVPRAFLKRVL